MHTVTTNKEEWLDLRRELLSKEKVLTHMRDEVSRMRRELPWVPVTKDYTFEGPHGNLSLSDLFEHRSQLIIYHFMYGPGWKQGCDGCSFLSDHIDGANQHLAHHDVTLIAVSRAPYQEFQAFKKRMGWDFTWISSSPSDFNYDFNVSFKAGEKGQYNFEEFVSDEDEELPGMSCFFKDENGQIFHTYSSYSRGGDILIGTYNWLDIAPLGRNEESTMNWMKLHDEYDAVPIPA